VVPAGLREEAAMGSEESVRLAFERNAKALELRPSIGRGTAVTRVRVRNGLTCDIEEGPWRLVADMHEKWGGAELGPNPGVYGRAAFGSCLAIGYVRWAAKLGVPIEGLEVEVQADYDSAAEHGLTNDPAGYRQVRYVVTVRSPASEAEIRRVLDVADAHSSYLDVFARAQDVRREVRVEQPARE
jgi:uncharacterized OsmC-like protein